MAREITTAALVALLRRGGKPAWRSALEAVETGSVIAELEAEHGLLAGDALDCAVTEIGAWERRGIRVLSPADGEYPDNLRTVADGCRSSGGTPWGARFGGSLPGNRGVFAFSSRRRGAPRW
jgi:hypothetical protein